MSVDRNLFDLKVETLRRCLHRIEEKTQNVTVDQFVADLDRQDIVAVNLERAIQACVDVAAHIVSRHSQSVPPTMAETIASLEQLQVVSSATSERLQKAVAFRNIAVHEYRRLDWRIVFSLATQHLGDFRDFAREVSQWLDRA